MKKKLNLLSFAAILLCAVPGAARAAFSGYDAGTAASQFLKLGPGARASGMGEAFTAAADDATALYWNPAGLAKVAGQEASFTHAQMFENIRYEWASYARQTPIGAFGAGVQYLSYGDITARDTAGAETGTLTPSDLCATLSYARHLLGIDAGISLKYISSEIQHRAAALAADAGAQYAVSGKLTLGAVFQNMGSAMKYDGESDPLPFLIKTGAAYRLADNWVAAADIIMPVDSSAYLGAGTEYTRKLGSSLAVSLRGGYNTVSKDVGCTKGFTLGLGLKYSGYSVDYAYTPLGDIGDTNRFSLSVQF